ncbi:hypothetical protein B0H16DRAFT_1420173, partial [Mycena metata]
MAASQQSQSHSSNNNNNKNNNTSLPSSAAFSFKAPFLPASATASTSTSTSTSASSSGTDIACAPNAAEGSGQQKQRRVSLALPSSPRLVPAWNFRDDTSVPYADAAGRKGKVRRIDTARDEHEGGEDGEEDAEGGKEGVVVKEGGVKEKKVRRKWTPAETQMLVDGCTKHGVGNWKAILSDPALTFAGRSPVDLKDRFRTYFPEAYRTHYPNARTHLPPSLARAATSTSTSPDSLAPSSSSATTTSRRPFTPEEDSALLAGFRKHGAAWAAIAKEAPVFGVTGRRSMDLRDRFRNAWPGEY